MKITIRKNINSSIGENDYINYSLIFDQVEENMDITQIDMDYSDILALHSFLTRYVAKTKKEEGGRDE